jgi:3-oxoacyl-[acyl-carrier protein] reductase
MDLGLKDQVALVTASSKGLGKAAALQLAREGAHLAMCARGDELERAADAIRVETDVEVKTFKVDLLETNQISKMVDKTLEAFSKIDILVINAGGPPPGNFMDFSPVEWREAINLTLMSAVELCYAVVPHMIDQGSGCITAIQSVSIKQPIDNLILSNSIRMAVIGLIKSLANELAPKGIRANSINPTWTYTSRVEQLLSDRANRNGTTLEVEKSNITAGIPLGRMGTVEEFGKIVTWLCSPAASFTTGQALMFDGGSVRSVL